MLELYRRIWNVTGQAQILLIVLSLAIAALAAAPLQFQKDIVNGLTEAMERRQLVMLCAGYVAVLLLSSGLKFALQYKSSTLSESVIRRIRERLYSEGTAGTSTVEERGTLVTMIAAEAEEVGQFAGAAIASPLMQLGTLFSVVIYIAANEPFLGLLLVVVVVPQVVIVLTMQRHINERVAKRIRILRDATGSIAAAQADQIEQAVLDDFDRIYESRRQLFVFKLSMKFVLNIINGLGTVGILLLGGFLVLEGETDIGSVVASLSALMRILGPWKELIAFYRDLSAVRVKFELLLMPPRVRQN